MTDPGHVNHESPGRRGAVMDGTVVPYGSNVKTNKRWSAYGAVQDSNGGGAAVANAQARTRPGGSVKRPGFYVK